MLRNLKLQENPDDWKRKHVIFSSSMVPSNSLYKELDENINDKDEQLHTLSNMPCFSYGKFCLDFIGMIYFPI